MVERGFARGRSLLLAVVACALVGGGFVVVASRSETTSASSSPADAGAPASAPQVPAAASASFGILRQAVGQEDAMGSYAANARIFAADFGADLSQTHRVALDQPGSRAWVAPSRDGVCLMAIPAFDKQATGPAGGCTDVERAQRGLLLSVMGTAPNVEIVGVMPDGVDQVVVTLADGSRTSAPVVANVYDVRASQGTASIAWSDATGAHSLEARSADGA